eukprot:2191224-Karenia_brevis.AAC.1
MPEIPGVYFENEPRTQCADIHATFSLTLEKGLDCKGAGAVASGDIGRYYDAILVPVVFEWCVAWGMDIAITYATGPVQLLPA